jgi:hypothetical protein
MSHYHQQANVYASFLPGSLCPIILALLCSARAGMQKGAVFMGHLVSYITSRAL